MIIDKSLYYEIHVTIKPEGIDKKQALIELGKENGDFRLATLLMRKGDELVYQDDQFFTSRCDTFEDALVAVILFCKVLKESGFWVQRYKIEDTRLDSKVLDQLLLCS